MIEVRREDAVDLDDASAIELLKRLVELWVADSGTAYRSVWDDDQQRRKEFEIASYERRRWPSPMPSNVVRHAQGVIKLAF